MAHQQQLQLQVLACLQHMQGPDPQGIKQAEQQLSVLSTQPGYGCVLLAVALAPPEQVPQTHTRQLAAVLLKQYIKQHWIAGERGFEPPEASREDKAAIRSGLPAGLRDPDSKIRTAIAMAIAAVANWDLPQEWPGLLESIVSSIKQGTDPNLVAGCLRCLSVMSSDLDSEQAPQLLQALSAELAALAHNPNTPPALSAPCFNIMAQLVSALGSLSGAYQRQVRGLLVPLVQPWVPLVCAALGHDPAARPLWPTKLAALRLGQAVTSYFSKPLAAVMPPLMTASWQLLLALQPLHQALLVEGQDDDGGDDAEGAAGADGGDEEVVGLETVVAQLFELLCTFVGKRQFQGQLGAGLKDLMYSSIAYLQMSQEQADSWVHSSSQFVEDEEEDWTNCRACAQLLVSDVAETFADAGAVPAVLEGVVRRWSEADAAAAAGKACWWQLREAGMLAVLTCISEVLDAVDEQQLPVQHVHQLLDQLLQRDLQPLLLQPQQQQQLGDAGQQFVMGRALLLGAQLERAATGQHKEQLLKAAAAAVMSQHSTPPLRLLGYRALSQLVPAVPAQQLAPLMHLLLPSLLQQLAASDEESLHLVLELLCVVVAGAAGPGSAGLTPEQALAVAQPVLQVWLKHTADPLIAPDALEVIDALAGHSQCLPSLVQAAAPTLAAILQRGAAVRLAKQQGQPTAAAAAAAAAAAGGAAVPEETPMLVEASLDLLGTLIKPGQDATNVELCRGVLGAVMHLIQSTGDASEFSSANSLLLKFMRTLPPQQLLHCAGSATSSTSNGSSSSSSSEEEAGLAALLTVARQLMASKQADGGMAAGVYLAQLVKLVPQQLCGGPMSPALAAAVAGAAAAASSNGSAAAAAAVPAGASCVALLLHDVVSMMTQGRCSPVGVARLMEFVVRLVLLPVPGPQGVVEMLASMAVPNKDGSSATSGLSVLLPLWLEHATDMAGVLQTKHCAAALLELLKLRHHPALTGVMVQGRLLEQAPAVGGGGRVTRARAAAAGGLRFSQIPAPVKMVQVLGALLSAEAESAGGGAGGGMGGGLWGTEDSDDDDYSDDDSNGAGGGAEGAAVEHAEHAAVLKAAGLAGSVSQEDLLHDVMDRSASATPLPDDPADSLQDPLAAISMRSIVKQGLGALAASDPGFLSGAAEQLGPGREVSVLQELLIGN